MAIINTPIPQDKIGECFVWRDWFQRLSNAVFGSMAGQNSNNVSITGGDIHANTLSVDSGLDGQVLIGKSLDHSFTPAYLTAGKGIGITNAPASVTLRNTGVTSVIAGTGIAVSSATGDVTISQTASTTRAYGAFQDTNTSQTALSNVVTQLIINTVDFTYGITKASGSNRIYITNAGVYSIIISLQLKNTSANYDDFTIWPTINGTAQTASASVVAVPVKKGSIDGHTVICVQYTYQFTAGQYLEFYWYNLNGDAAVVTFPASTSTPIHPAAAGVILSVIQVG